MHSRWLLFWLFYYYFFFLLHFMITNIIGCRENFAGKVIIWKFISIFRRIDEFSFIWLRDLRIFRFVFSTSVLVLLIWYHYGSVSISKFQMLFVTHPKCARANLTILIFTNKSGIFRWFWFVVYDFAVRNEEK